VLLLGQAGALSGGDVHALRLTGALADSGNCSVRLFGGAGLDQVAKTSTLGATTLISTPFDRAMRRNTIALVAGIAWRMALAIKRAGVRNDLVIASSHLLFDVAVAVVVARRSRGRAVAFVYHLIHDMDRPRGWRTGAARRAEALSLALLRRSRAVVFADNDETESGLLARGFDPALVNRTENAYDPEPPTLADPASTSETSAGSQLVFVGRLVDQKGIWDVVDVARALHGAGSSATVLMIGDGPERESLEAIAGDEALSNLRLLGFVDEADKWHLLSTSDLFLAPSREEGWGIAVGEALLAGVPVVALDLPAYRHFPVAFNRVPMGGPAFVRRVLELIADPAELDRQRNEVRRGRSSLPRWADVVRADMEVLEGALADVPS
jgi:glycosyltransferase involved in cell wall biosynthesis